MKVLDVDVERQRIGLSLRLNDTPQQDRGKRTERDKPRQGKRPPSPGKNAARKAPNPPAGSMGDALRKAGFGS